MKARAATGVGVIEAPRGVLIHDYDTDDKGMITKANIIVATAHNNKAINEGLKNTARKIIGMPTPSEGILNRMEMIIRAYDPCFSCATHSVPGKMPLEILINRPDGIITGTSISRPITAASACPDWMPKMPTETAMDSTCLAKHTSPVEDYLRNHAIY